MNDLVNRNSIVPLSIELLFNNEKLDLMKFLYLLHAFSLKSNRRIKVSEVLFYYSLVNFNLRIFIEDNQENKRSIEQPSINQYFRFQSKIQKILLDISHLQFAEFKGELSKKLDEITLKITPEGTAICEEINSPFFEDLKISYLEVIGTIKFTASNQKLITEGDK